MQQMTELCRHLLAFVRPDLNLGKSFLAVIRMIFFQEGVLLLGGHSSWLHAHTRVTRRFHLFYGFEHFRCKHIHPSLFLNLSCIVKFFHLFDRLLHDLLNQSIVSALVNLLHTVAQML